MKRRNYCSKGFMEKEKQQFKTKMQTDKEEIERGKKSL